MTKPKISEANVKKAVFHYLNVKGHFWWPINNTGIWHPEKKTFMRSRTLRPGVSDAMALLNGKLYAIELKSSTGRLRGSQEEFKRGVEENGGVYLVVRSVEDLIAAGL